MSWWRDIRLSGNCLQEMGGDAAEFLELWRDVDPVRLASELREFGFPEALLPSLPESSEPSRQDVSAVRAALRALAPYVAPLAPLCLEVAANLDPNDPRAVLWLAGLRVVRKTRGGGCSTAAYHGDEQTVSARQCDALGRSLAVVQNVANQVAQGYEKVTLLADEARRFRRLARADRERPDEAPKDRMPLVEVLDGSESIPNGARAKKGFGGRPEVSGSWLHDLDGGDDVQFAENWVLARAAAFLTSVCRGPGHAHLANGRVGHCRVCKTYYVEDERRGPDATRCPDCRRLSPAPRLVKKRDGQLAQLRQFGPPGARRGP